MLPVTRFFYDRFAAVRLEQAEGALVARQMPAGGWWA
jgi:hypothetical protein